MQIKSFDLDSLLRRFEALRRPYLWIALICFLLVVPAIVLRGAHFEEGTVIGLARGAFEDGHWRTPFLYGQRFAERPVLFSWLLALAGLATGTLTDWMARIPVALSLFAGASLVFYLVRKYASASAAFFGVLCFAASPIVLQKVVTAETDLFVSVLVFFAFVVLWDGERQGGAGVGRWLAVALILSFAVLVKGPPPLGFFFVGLGAYFLLRREWLNFIKLGLVGLIPAGLVVAWYAQVYQPGDEANWLRYNRLNPVSAGRYIRDIVAFIIAASVQFLPGWPLVMPRAVAALRRPLAPEDKLLAALVLYAGPCLALLMLWPGAHPRYAMPAVLAIAAAAGIGFDRLRTDYPRMVRATSLIVAALLLYRLTLNWLIMPLAPQLFQRSRYYGQVIAETVAVRPATVYVAWDAMDANLLVYVPFRVRSLPFAAFAKLQAPAWALVTPEEEQKLRSLKPGNALVRHLAGRWPFAWDLIEIR
jgi:4-amino-4-deoxy-L-arabinose transferase-like glycosyltransferase